ncbi:hypothetical protein HELRODRAFT_89315 [Helobdella robusta]|uniref:Dr1-associated corepressor n=1 Tax=Helobdella robusta TaxID=6412 RepID=T1G7C0_HELRO|nr:hypothetical protein HELRODRAFT_89315 [Helobdella robusta]ESN92532.1 hypothetical protein HELRODRAFT_89315 [Helobdella robusta]
MPNKKKKYSARFPPARIKKIMQKDEEVGKVAAAVPVIISRSLELFIESLIKKTNDLVILKNAKTLTPQHIKQTVLQDKEFKFLSELVSSIPDIQPNEDDNQQETGASLPRQSQPTSSTFIPSHSTSNLPSPNFGGRSGASGVLAKVSTGKPRGR